MQKENMYILYLKVDYVQYKNLHISLYFIATKNLWNNAPVECIDNSTCTSYTEIIKNNN